MAGTKRAMSWWEVAEMVYERRSGWSWEQIGQYHGISHHKARREVQAFVDLAKEACHDR